MGVDRLHPVDSDILYGERQTVALMQQTAKRVED